MLRWLCAPALMLCACGAGAQILLPVTSALQPPAQTTAPPSGTRPLPPDPANAPRLGPPPIPQLEYHADTYQADANGDFSANGNVGVTYAGATLTSDHVEGNFNRELVFSGHAKLETKGAVARADAIHLFVRTRSYRLDNPHATLAPEFLQERVLDPVFVNGGELSGERTGYAIAEQFRATTCIEVRPHYELRVASAELFPHQRLILRHVGVVFFGQKIIVLPYLVIPLDPRPRRARTDYLPEFGRNINEGYFARFPYTFAEGAVAATFVRADLTEKLGPGYRIEQEYLAGKQDSPYNTSGYGYSGGGLNVGLGGLGGEGAITQAYGYGTVGPRLPRLGTGLGPQSGGLFAVQGYLKDGFDRNFNASFRHQQSIGSNNHFGITTEFQRNSYLLFSNQTSQNTHFDFAHDDITHGVSADLSAALATNDSGGFSTNQLTGSYRQSFDFASQGSNRNNLAYNFDFSRYLTTSTTGDATTVQRTAQLDSNFQFRHVSRDYSFSAQANAVTPIGTQTSTGSFGSLERLPELQFSSDTYNFKSGWLRRLPLHFDLGVGRYSEPSSETQSDRVLLGVTLQDTPILRGRTEATIGGGFEQRVYDDGAAQYIVRNSTRLRQHLGGRSGVDFSYQYQQPAGGTPFFFDTFTPSHYVTAEGGYLDDSHFQWTARVGYDFLGASQSHPWQSLSTRLMWRPGSSFRFDSLATYDPNTSRFFALTNMFRFRAAGDFAIDLVTRYDPQQGKFSQLNGQFDIPLGRTWRLSGLLRYNGFRGALESTNLQITHDWDCLEASLSYTDSPLSFRNDREIFFTIRIKAFPFFRSFNHGAAGEALGTGIGDLY